MKLFKTLKNCVDPCDSLIGFGFPRAKDYKKNKYGHLIIFSFNLKNIKLMKKLFIGI